MRSRTLALSSVILATAATLSAVTPASAGGPGVWTQLSRGHLSNIDDPSVVRVGTDLQVVWTEDNETNLMTADLTRTGALRSGPVAIQSGWSSVNEFPAVFVENGQRVVAFSGVHSTSTSDPYNGDAVYAATSSNGTTWTLAPGSLSAADAAYASYGSDATDAAGTTVAAFTAGSASAITYHAGYSSSNPANTPDSQTSTTGPNVYYTGVGHDAATGAVWAVWYCNSGTATDGFDAQQIYPSLGTLFHAPYSTNSGSSVAPIQRVIVASRAGGGLYTAYGVGYPSQTAIAVWKLGAAKPFIIHTGYTVGTVGVAAGPRGRIWVFWRRLGTNAIYAVRSNAAVTHFEPVTGLHAPGGTSEVWKTAGDGTNGPLDLVVNAGTAPQIFSTQVRPRLSAAVSPYTVRSSTGGVVTVTVTDAGTAFTNAAVRYGRTTHLTNSHGYTRFTIPAGTSRGYHAFAVTAPGYTGATVYIRVS